MATQETDFYKNLRKKFMDWVGTEEGKTHKWAEYLILAPDFFHLMCKLVLDQRVSIEDKAKLGGAIVYFISPIDLIPEAIVGPVGYIDDIALSAYVLNTVIKNTPEEVLQEHWAGKGDILEQVKKILDLADQMIGSGLWNKIKSKIDDFSK